MPYIRIVPEGPIEEARANTLKHLKDGDEETKNIFRTVHPENGEKLLIEAEVTDWFMASSVFDLLFGKVPGAEYLGFQVTSVQKGFHGLETYVREKVKELICQTQDFSAGTIIDKHHHLPELPYTEKQTNGYSKERLQNITKQIKGFIQNHPQYHCYDLVMDQLNPNELLMIEELMDTGYPMLRRMLDGIAIRQKEEEIK